MRKLAKDTEAAALMNSPVAEIFKSQSAFDKEGIFKANLFVPDNPNYDKASERYPVSHIRKSDERKTGCQLLQESLLHTNRTLDCILTGSPCNAHESPVLLSQFVEMGKGVMKRLI